jgi:hypothetical protein
MPRSVFDQLPTVPAARRMTPTLVVNPTADEPFATRARALVAEGVDTIMALQTALREAGYPRTVVRARELSSEPAQVWYVYREGTWVPSSEPRDR